MPAYDLAKVKKRVIERLADRLLECGLAQKSDSQVELTALSLLVGLAEKDPNVEPIARLVFGIGENEVRFSENPPESDLTQAPT